MDTGIILGLLALAGTLSASYITYRTSKNATRVGLEANAFQRAVRAEEKSSAAEDKVDAMILRLRSAERDMVSIESRMRYIILLIHDPYMSLELLRERVPLNFKTTRGDDND